ncbi:MAG: CDP-alcohol phosphatidyltransferase family protein [Candidatus Babeliales bacterium]
MQLNELIARFSRTNHRLTIPTLLTLARIAVTPCIIFAMVYQYWGIAFSLFVFAAITDLLDGFLARILDQKSLLGACLDPIADKLLTLSVFGTLAFVQSPLFAIPAWFVIIMLIKELLLMLGAGLVYLICGQLRIAPLKIGKIAMFAQVMFIIWLFACYFFQWVPVRTYWAMLLLVMAVVLWAFIRYTLVGISQLRRCR